jgi:hypothetical protein
MERLNTSNSATADLLEGRCKQLHEELCLWWG